MPLNTESIRHALSDHELYYFPLTQSTMNEAARLAEAGVPDGTVVLADEQSHGVGRFGRHWVSQPEMGIYCSIIHRLPLALSQLPVLTLALALAAAEAIQDATDIACDLRWPNDVLIDGRKTAGIIAHLQQDCVISGIGINVNHDSLPEDLRTPATSLRMAAGRMFAREPIVVSLVRKVDSLAALLIETGASTIIQAFSAASSFVLHRRVVFDGPDGPAAGVTLGLDDNGFLRVRDDAGTVHTILSGGIRPEI
jgi:BirA family biotin operon repressor/biotin-[acetyl-CoA-carboxylase] ligase